MILKREADRNKKEKERKERKREISRWKEQLCWYLIRIHSMLPDNKLQFNTERERESYTWVSVNTIVFLHYQSDINRKRVIGLNQEETLRNKLPLTPKAS